MDTKRFTRVLLLFSVCVLATSCAHVVSKDIRQQVRKDLTFTMVQQDPDKYLGETVIWGGAILETFNEKNDTIVKVLQAPLNFNEVPGLEEYSQGRFIAKIPGYADREVYRRGMKITVAGRIAGERVEKVGDREYVYPMVEVQEKYLWQRSPGYWGPHEYDPYYWGGYGYPYYWYGYPYYGYGYPYYGYGYPYYRPPFRFHLFYHHHR